MPQSEQMGAQNAPQMWPGLEFAPHPKAPTFSREADPALLLRHLVAEVSSPNMQTSEKVLGLLREAGFVSLWFYLKFIAGSDGPYDKLNNGLHVDMCNFRQRVATEPGIKAGILVPRSSYKTSICSHGANGWELLRNPNLRIGCTSQLYDRALSFVQSTINTFSVNELHKTLYPEWTKANRSNDMLILDNRTRRFPEPNLMAITAGGSTQGIHVDVFDCDDIVGEDMLNSDHVAGADMSKMNNWLYSNLRTLVVSWVESRVIVVGTRYAVDDPYERLMKETKERLGYWDPIDSSYPANSKGDWVTYYRPALQEDANGNEYSINPDAFTVEQIHQLLESDPWAAYSQYMNNPVAAGASDFASYEVGECTLDWDDTQETFFIQKKRDFSETGRVDLRDCDVVIAGDPSGGSTRASFSASRAAVAVVARSPRDERFIIEAEAGYVEPTKFFDWLFKYKDKYKHVVRATYVEAQAGFKSFVPILRREEAFRKKFLNFLGIPALGDKETTIRNIIQPVLEKGQLYVRDTCRGKVMEELRVFPSKRLDLLDAIKIAMFKTIRPRGDGADVDDDDDDTPLGRMRSTRQNVSSVTGY